LAEGGAFDLLLILILAFDFVFDFVSRCHPERSAAESKEP
jgi:Na+-transporting methylmalonyl-CoA/oxaloacetate decarboxylase gamma subunit